MSDGYATLLGVSRVIVALLRILNLLIATLLVGMFVATFVLEPMFLQVFGGKQPPRIDPGLLLPILRLWIVLSAPMFVAVHIQLSRLLAMIETVRAGDPFVPENAVRMKTIAWCLLATQALSLAYGVMAMLMNWAGSRIEW